MNKIPLIIDTDLTRDDIVAVAMAANCGKYDIKAISCYGEWFVETVQLRDSLGLDCPVCWGAMKPLFRQENGEDIYGNTDADFDGKTSIGTKDEDYPWDRIYSEAVKAQGKLEIVTLGPVTNIALTLLRYPQIKPLIKHIFCFAGSAYKGNILPYSEYNAYSDPDALKIVFDSGIAVTMCGLDGIESCAVETGEIKNIHSLNDMVEKSMQIYRRTNEADVSIESAAAMSCYIDSDAVQTKDFYVAVETKIGITRGQTIVDRLGKYKKAPNIRVVTAGNRKAFIENLKNIEK
ncbi:MAG: nucleoside hydrolase [Oscillospiraceae bacterium]|nr:nucleoside hydrolase [Oscillospiraceae bacterium]